jgi:hypothetical protein
MKAMHVLIRKHVEKSAGKKGTSSSEFCEKDQDETGVHEGAGEPCDAEENNFSAVRRIYGT